MQDACLAMQTLPEAAWVGLPGACAPDVQQVHCTEVTSAGSFVQSYLGLLPPGVPTEGEGSFSHHQVGEGGHCI